MTTIPVLLLDARAVVLDEKDISDATVSVDIHKLNT